MIEPIFISIDDTARLLGVGKAKVYLLIQDGELSLVKIGRKSVIARADIDAFAKRRIKAAAAGGLASIVPHRHRRKVPVEAAE